MKEYVSKLRSNKTGHMFRLYKQKRIVKQDRQSLFKCLNRLQCLTDPCQCVSKGLYVLSGRRKTVLTRELDMSSFTLILFFILFYGMAVNGVHVFFPRANI